MTNRNRLRVHLIGSESLLIQCAETLLERGHHLKGVITRDEAIARWALDRGVHVIGPGAGLAERLAEEPFDWLLSVANLSIVADEVLALPQCGAVNFHDGPLPDMAGLNCPSWSLLRRRPSHGISWHLMEGGVDEGDVLVERSFDVEPRDTALTLNTRCYELGMETFGELLEQLESGQLQRRPQDPSRRAYFGRHDRPDATSALPWEAPAEDLDASVRALDFGPYRNPLGVAKAWAGSEPLLVQRTEVVPASTEPASPGTVVAAEEAGLDVATGAGVLRVTRACTADGEELSPATIAERFGIGVGAAFHLVDPARRRVLAELVALAARDEGFWVRRFGRRVGAGLPLVDRAAPRGEVEVRALTLPSGSGADRAVALFAAWASRVGGESQVRLGFRAASTAEKLQEGQGLFPALVPFDVDLLADAPLEAVAGAVAEERGRLQERTPYLRDLIVRHPGLSRPQLDAAVELVEPGRDVPNGWARSAAPITLRVEGDGGVRLRVDAGRVAPGAVDRIAAQLEAMADAASAEPATPVGRLPLLSADERAEVLERWNETTVPLPSERCVHRLVEGQVDRTPDATALIFGGEALSYRELDERANRLAHHLRTHGVGPGATVGLCTRRSPDMVIAALAIQKAGGAYVPLDPTYPVDRLQLMLVDSEARVVVADADGSDRLGDVSQTVVRLDADAAAIAACPSRRPDGSATPNDLAYVIYTSGSTGRPKGVMVEHRNVANFFVGMDRCVPRRGDGSDVWLAVTSLSFDISVLELFWTLARGFRVVLASDEQRTGAAGRPSSRPIGFSLFYFASDEGEGVRDKYRLLLEGARFADRHGFQAVWTPERHFHAFGGLYPNPSVASAALAMITDRVELRAGSCVVPLHHPVRVAEEWALVDNLSNGRVGISFAAGWQPNDFILRPESFADPKGTMMRDLEVVRRLWRGEEVEYEGPKGPVRVRSLPRPVRPELPVWLTAAGNPATFEAAGRAGAGLLTHLLGQSMEELRGKIQVYRRAWREAGHAGDGHVTLMLHTFVGTDDAEVKERVRGPMKSYLGSSLNLIREHAWAFPAFKRHAKEDASFEDNFQSLSPDDTDALLDHAFDRYYETSGLFGTPERAMNMVNACREGGIDEVACLIDFGIDSETVLAHLPHLEALRSRAQDATVSEPAEESLAELLVRHRVTHMQCTPTLARMLVDDDQARAALRGLDHLLVGGEALPGGLVRDLQSTTGAAITNMYGPTETTIWSTTHGAEPCAGTVPIGRPIGNTRLYVLDAWGQPAPIGVPGELFIAGEGVARGYYGREQLTSERFVADPFAGEGGRMYRTGDRVRWRDDGVLEFLGRTDHQVKIRGHRIEAGEIETQLVSHPAVVEAVVLVREDSPGDRRLVAYCLPRAGQVLEVDELRERLRASLPEVMVPSHVVVMDAWPLTPNGKIDRRSLPAPGPEGSKRRAEFVAPESEAEEALATIWKRLLGLAQVGAHDNFFDLGGHSLLAVQAHREIRNALACQISITDIFRFPTIASLADYLQKGTQGFGGDAERGAARRQAMQRRAAARRGHAPGR